MKLDSSESTASESADSAVGKGSGKGAVLLRVTLWGGSGVLNRGLTRPLLDLVTRVGVALATRVGVALATRVGVALATGRGGNLPDVLRFPVMLLPLLQVCLRDAEAELVGGVAPSRGVGGREMEYDLYPGELGPGLSALATLGIVR